MALTGVHVACAHVGGSAGGSQFVQFTRAPVWSETQTAAGSTTNVVPPGNDPYNQFGAYNLEVRSSADVYVAVGPTPDASNGPRLFVTGGIARNIIANSGDKLAWMFA